MHYNASFGSTVWLTWTHAGDEDEDEDDDDDDDEDDGRDVLAEVT